MMLMFNKKKEKQTDYFETFIQQARYACEAAEIIVELFNKFDTFDIPKTVEKLHKVETAGDFAKKKLTEALVGEFLPPIDRGDILTLANELDEVIDNVEDILRHIYMYNVTSIKSEALEFAEVVREICKATHDMIVEFKSFKKSSKLHALVVEVNTLEEKADDIYLRAIRNLYTTACDPRELIGWTRIYSIIEDCCDSCEHVANTVEMTAMKNT